MRAWWRTALQVACTVAACQAGATRLSADTDRDDDLPATDEASATLRSKSAPLSWLSGGMRPEQALYFAGFDVQRFGYGGYVGTVWSPVSGRDGFLFRLFAADSIDSYRTPKTTFRSQSLRAAAVPGYRISRPGFELSAYAGLEGLARVPLPFTKTSRLTYDFGMRLSTDIWWEPFNAVMIAANLSMTTIEASFYGRLATGVRIMTIWTGPEISASTDIFGEQYRAGLHVTGVRYGPYEFSAAAGYAFDSFGRSGAYGRLGVSLRTIDPITIMP